MGPCMVGEKARAISITIVGDSEGRSRLGIFLDPANTTRGLRRVSLSEPPTTVVLMARAFSQTLQGSISL